MDRNTTILIALMMTTVSLAGCSGDDSGFEETISSLEQEAVADEAAMAALNATISSLTTNLEALNAHITGLDSQIEALSLQNSTKSSHIEMMTLNVSSLEASKALLESQVSALETTIDGLKAQLEVRIFTADDVDAYWNQGYQYGLQAGQGNPVSTLDTIIDRGYMNCGIKESQYGMGYLDYETGVRSGLDITYCRAVAAAIGLDPDTDVEYVPASGSQRFAMLHEQTIDVLIRTSTWTAFRDAALDADFAAVNFYDGQAVIVREDRYAAAAAGNSVTGLASADICVGIGTTSEGNLQGYFDTHGIDFTSVPVGDYSEALSKLKDGSCDAWTGDASAMIAQKWMLENSDDHEDWRDSGDHTDLWVAAELLSKEPLAAATRDYDTEWNEIVSWVWYGVVTAEELGVTSGNYDTIDYSCNPGDSNYNLWICRLLTQDFGLGTEDNPLSSTWMQDVLEAVGNYGEMYDDAFCDGSYDGVSGSDAMTGCLMSRSGTLNALVSEGGIQYAPSMR